MNPLAFSGNMNHSPSDFFHYRLCNEKMESILLESKSLNDAEGITKAVRLKQAKTKISSYMISI